MSLTSILVLLWATNVYNSLLLNQVCSLNSNNPDVGGKQLRELTRIPLTHRASVTKEKFFLMVDT
jgi:hypothetical protein